MKYYFGYTGLNKTLLKLISTVPFYFSNVATIKLQIRLVIYKLDSAGLGNYALNLRITLDSSLTFTHV